VQSRIEIAVADPALLAGDWQPLLEQIGAAHDPVTLEAMAAWILTKPPANFARLRKFLVAYRDEQLLPRDLRIIRDAFHHAARGEARELIALDVAPETAPGLEPFLSASRRAGRDYLRRLRPLRDFRVAQRYRRAVEGGEAEGWHTLAYGVTLAAYAIPLRQGLLHYARTTLRSFAESAARPLGLAETQLAGLLDEITAPVGAAVDALIGTMRSERAGTR
jgi:urease accessory protein UreF